uniref:Bromodomain-containing protein n=1 Tax=Neospora caninum (strain Liverpool) TaxID=572307 RepID=A0A0F7UMM0_NEOCL|nr:TPA: bromodomain-containing protein [Neospora caninum Liverpool]
MTDELKLREQRLDVSVEDFREKILYGSTTLSIEVGAGVAAAVASAVDALANCLPATGDERQDRDSRPVVLPLQVPPACIVSRVWVDDEPAEFSLPSWRETEEGVSPLSSLLGDDQGGIHLDLLTLRLRTAREAARQDRERRLLVQLPEKTAQKFHARVRQRIRVTIDFKLVNPGHRSSSLYFSEHWLCPPQGRHRLYRLLLASQSPSSLPWFPTLPASAYASPLAATEPQKGRGAAAKSSKEAPAACSRCRWIVSIDVPAGNVGIGPGRLVRRARVWRRRRSEGEREEKEENEDREEKEKKEKERERVKETRREAGGTGDEQNRGEGGEHMLGQEAASSVSGSGNGAKRVLFERFLYVVEPPPKRGSAGADQSKAALAGVAPPSASASARAKTHKEAPAASVANLPLLPPQVSLFAGPLSAVDGNGEAVAYPVTASSIGLTTRQPQKAAKGDEGVFLGDEPREAEDDAEREGDKAEDEDGGEKNDEDDDAEDGEKKKEAMDASGGEDNDSLVSGVQSDVRPVSSSLEPLPSAASSPAGPAQASAGLGAGGDQRRGEGQTGQRDTPQEEDWANRERRENGDTEDAQAPHNVPTVTYMTLKGFESLLSPTTAAVPLCFRVYSRALSSPSPFSSLILLFLPIAVEGGVSWAVPSSSSVDAAGTAESADEGSRGFAEVADTSAADVAVGADLNRGQLPQFHLSRNLIVFPLDLLHSEEQVGVDASCYSARILIAEGLATAWLDAYTFFWSCGDPRKQIDGCALFLGTVKTLVDLFIQANFGLVELKIRRWERLLRYVALVEAGGEEFPLDSTSVFSASLPPPLSGTPTPLVPSLEHLYFSEVYQLKSSIALQALDRLLASQSLLPSQFFFDFLMRQYLPMLAKKREPPNTDRFWKKLLFHVTLRYISHWNRRPANTAGGRQRLRLKEKKKKVWGVAALGLCVEGEDGVVEVNPQDHDVLAQLEEALLSFRSAFISGTGCPQLTLAFVVQLQRKGSSMDFFNFHLDLLSLQPPASLAASLALPRALAAFRKAKSDAKGGEEATSFFFRPKDERVPGAELDRAADRRSLASPGIFSKRKEEPGRGDGEERQPSFYPADLAGLAAFNLWEAYEICRLRQQSGVDLLSASQDACALSSWETLLHRSAFPTLRLPSSPAAAAVVATSHISRTFPWDQAQICDFFARLLFAFCGVSLSPVAVEPSRRTDGATLGDGRDAETDKPAEVAESAADALGASDSPTRSQAAFLSKAEMQIKHEHAPQNAPRNPARDPLFAPAASFASPPTSAPSSRSLLVSLLSSAPSGSALPSARCLSSVFSLLLPAAREAAAFLILAPSVSSLLYLPQRVYDPVDVVGRDGNFILGFGYTGETPAVFNAGRGGLWAATREALRRLQRKAEQKRRKLARQARGDGRGPARALAGRADPDEEGSGDGADGAGMETGAGAGDAFGGRKRRRSRDLEDDGEEPLDLGRPTGGAGDAEGSAERRLEGAPGDEQGWEEMTEEKFALACVDSEAAPPTLPVVTTGGLPYWALLLHQRGQLSRLRCRLLSHASPASVHGSAGLAPASVSARSSDSPLLCPANVGSLLCASVGYEKYWLPSLCLQVVEDDGVRTSIVRLREGVLPLRFALDPRAERGRKKVALRGDRVVHGTSSNKLMMKAADAAAAATDAPAAAAAAASGVSAVEGVAPGGTSCAAGPSGPGGAETSGGGGFTSADQVRFTGELSSSDRGLIEALKRCVIAKHPSLLSLDNRSLVAKVNSKTKLPVLWLRADPMQVWIGRIRRCQSGSMWEQQLLNDVNISAQLEAALALGSIRSGEDILGTLSDPAAGSGALSAEPLSRERAEHTANFLAAGDCLARDAVNSLARALAFHRWHPLLRSRVVYALCFLHNRVRSEQLAVWSSFVSYMHTFHYDNLGDEDRIQHAAARLSLLSNSESASLQRSASPLLASPSDDSRGVYGDQAATLEGLGNGPNPAAETRGTFFRIGEVAASTPEMRFLRHFYAAVSLLRDPEGLTRPEVIEMLLQPLVSTNIGGSSPPDAQLSGHPSAVGPEKELEDEETDTFPPGETEKTNVERTKARHEGGNGASKTASVDLLCFIASVVDCFGNIKCPYTPYPAYAETRHPYFSFLCEREDPMPASPQTPARLHPHVRRLESSREGGEARQAERGQSWVNPPDPAAAPGCKCGDLTLGVLLSSFVASRSSETHRAFASDAEWEAFVTKNARGVEAAWLNLWRLFRLDSVRSLASPRHAISCAFLRAISRQPMLRDLARRRFLRISSSATSYQTSFASHLLSLLGEKRRPEQALALGRDVWRGKEGGEADGEERVEEQTPLDFLIFVPLRTHDKYLREKAYSAYELHYAYHDFAVHREAIRAQLLVCCEGAVRVYRVPLSSSPQRANRAVSSAHRGAGDAPGRSQQRSREAGEGLDSERTEGRESETESEIRRQRQNLGGLSGPYTLVSKFVSPEEQVKRVQLGLGVYTALQCAVEMERLLRPDEARLPITIWEVFLDVLEELRVRSPALFLPFATSLVELHSGTGLGQPPSAASRSASSRQPASCAWSAPASFCLGSAGGRPAFCRLLGCLGPCCSPLVPATPLPTALLVAPTADAGGACSASAASARHQQQMHLQDHAVSVALTVSQAACAYLSCYLSTEAWAAARGNRAAFAQKLCYAQNVYAFLFGVDIPFCCHPGAAQLARLAVSPLGPQTGDLERSCGSSREAPSPLWSQTRRPGAAAGAAAFCLTPHPGEAGGGSAVPEALISLAGAGELQCVEEDAATEYDLCLKAGSRQRKMWTFKRKYMDNAQHTAHWVDVAIEAVGALMELPEAVWFIPDPETTVNEYRLVIQEPMWLKKVQAKLKAGLYKLPYHFKQDVALIFRNARTFNRPDDRPYRDCCVVEQKFNRLWGCINQAFQRAAKSHRTGSDAAQPRQPGPVSSSTPGDASSVSARYPPLYPQQMSYEQQLLAATQPAGVLQSGLGMHTPEQFEQLARGGSAATVSATGSFFDPQGSGPYNGQHESVGGTIQYGFMPAAVQPANPPVGKGHTE